MKGYSVEKGERRESEKWLATFKDHMKLIFYFVNTCYILQLKKCVLKKAEVTVFLDHFPSAPALCLIGAYCVLIEKTFEKGDHNVGTQNHTVVYNGILLNHKKD